MIKILLLILLIWFIIIQRIRFKRMDRCVTVHEDETITIDFSKQ